MYLTTGLAGKPVGDELLEVIADFDPDLPIVDGQEDEQPVVLAALADAASAVLEHLDRVFPDVGVGLERLDGGDDDDVAARLLQGADERVHLGRARRIDHAGEIVDRLRELRRLLRVAGAAQDQQRDNDNHEGHDGFEGHENPYLDSCPS